MANKTKKEWIEEANAEPLNLNIELDTEKTIEEIKALIEAKKTELEGTNQDNVNDNPLDENKEPDNVNDIKEEVKEEAKEVIYKITCPNKQYTGVSATVSFVQGKGEIKDSHLAEWFKEKGYTVEEA